MVNKKAESIEKWRDIHTPLSMENSRRRIFTQAGTLRYHGCMMNGHAQSSVMLNVQRICDYGSAHGCQQSVAPCLFLPTWLSISISLCVIFPFPICSLQGPGNLWWQIWNLYSVFWTHICLQDLRNVMQNAC